MLTRKQLKEHYMEDLPLHILELDYIQSLMLKGIYSRGDALVFKGGTCLRQAFGLDRYSEDLDFNLMTGDPEKGLQDGIRGLKLAGIEAWLTSIKERRDIYLATVRYKGPLYTESELSKGSLQLEISKRQTIKDPLWINIMSRLPDVGSHGVMTMDPEEMLAEKLRFLVQRNKPRDIYDIWFLLKKGTTCRQSLLDTKMEEVGLEPQPIRNIIEVYRLTDQSWKDDMGNLTNRIPKKEAILGCIRETLG